MTKETNFPAYTTGDIHGPVIKAIQQLHLNQNAKILDIGCGSGLLLKRIHDELGYKQLSGIDIDPNHGLDFADLYQCDLDHIALPFADYSVDLILATEVIEHIMNISSLLTEFKRVLSPNGFVILTTPNLGSIEARLRFFLTGRLRQFDFRGDPTHCTPIHLFPFNRVLEWHGLSTRDFLGVPEKGSPPTSRIWLRILAKCCKALGLKEAVRGDSVLMIIQNSKNHPYSLPKQKQQILRAHYDKSG